MYHHNHNHNFNKPLSIKNPINVVEKRGIALLHEGNWISVGRYTKSWALFTVQFRVKTEHLYRIGLIAAIKEAFYCSPSTESARKHLETLGRKKWPNVGWSDFGESFDDHYNGGYGMSTLVWDELLRAAIYRSKAEERKLENETKEAKLKAYRDELRVSGYVSRKVQVIKY